MNIKKDSFIIVEIIPSNRRENGGCIVQLSALKIKNLKVIERFDYRLNDDALPFLELKEFINYDNHLFSYVDSEDIIINKFKKFSKKLPLLLLDNIYTPSFLDYLDNKQELILDYLNLTYDKDIINTIMNKYHLMPSNHIVDLLYEALMMEY